MIGLLLALASQTAFYDLHQAVGHLERAATKPACVTHRVAAQAHLAAVPEALPPAWDRIRDALVVALDTPELTASDLEHLRVDLHALAEAAKLTHEISWRAAFERCPD
jgi:hypothetical protein